jgi:ion channel POLLUX/CASTOR
VMDSDNTELVLQVGVKDYLISNQFVSKIFAQVAQEPDVKRVYDDLFREEGSEIYLKPASLYFPTLPVTLPFGDCIAAAQLRAEVCFGYRLAADAADLGKAHGIHIIPAKTEQVTLNLGDCLITLAENES